MRQILGIIISYILGSIPTAYILVRLLKGIDIRKFGSGNIGATNALRVLGKPAGIIVLILDMLKGFLAVILVGNLFAATIALRIIFGLACISGHNWTIFLKFKGGKGVATTLGVLLGLAAKISGLKIVFILVISTWLLVFIFSRIVSLSSIIAALALPVYTFIFHLPPELVLFSVLLSAFIILRHKSNLTRIFQGKEPRLSFTPPFVKPPRS